MAITQIRRDTAGRAYYLRKRTTRKNHNEAMRCLKRRLSDTLYRQLLKRHQRHDLTQRGASLIDATPRFVHCH